MDSTQLKKLAADFFDNHPESDMAYASSDGALFKVKNHRDTHCKLRATEKTDYKRPVKEEVVKQKRKRKSKEE